MNKVSENVNNFSEILRVESETPIIKTVPDRLMFVFEKLDFGNSIEKTIKIYNQSSKSLKIVLFPSGSENFKFKHGSYAKLMPGIPLTVPIVFQPTNGVEYSDCLRIACQDDDSFAVPIIAIPRIGISDPISDKMLLHDSLEKGSITRVEVNKNKRVKDKYKYRKLVRFRVDPDSRKKENYHALTGGSRTLNQHEINTALIKKVSPSRDPNELLGPNGIFQNDYLIRRKKCEEEFFEKVKKIQLEDASVERNSNIERLFNTEISNEVIEGIENYRKRHLEKHKEILTENEGGSPIYLRQRLIMESEQSSHWRPPKQEPDLWISRYQALWRFIQAARSVLIYNRLKKRLEQLKLFCSAHGTSLLLSKSDLPNEQRSSVTKATEST